MEHALGIRFCKQKARDSSIHAVVFVMGFSLALVLCDRAPEEGSSLGASWINLLLWESLPSSGPSCLSAVSTVTRLPCSP